MFKVNNKDTRTMPLASFGVFIVNFEHISHLVLMFLVNIEQVNADWVFYEFDLKSSRF